MRFLTPTVILVFVIAYIVGARYPGMASKIGLA